MSNYTTDADILEWEPSIKEYGIIDFSTYHAKTKDDVNRWLRIHWWPKVRRASMNRNASYFNSAEAEMDETKLTASQLKTASVFHILAYYILPQLTQHGAEPDRFRMMIDFYKNKWLEEIQLVLQDGVEYDWDDSGTVENTEKQPEHFNRLVR